MKLAFMNKFTMFIEWPEDSGLKQAEQFKIGVFGQNPFGEQMDQFCKTQKIKGKSVVWKLIKESDEMDEYNMIFVPKSKAGFANTLEDKLALSPILIITERLGIQNKLGHINFIVENGKIRFEISKTRCEKSKFKVGAQLYQLAKKVN